MYKGDAVIGKDAQGNYVDLPSSSYINQPIYIEMALYYITGDNIHGVYYLSTKYLSLCYVDV